MFWKVVLLNVDDQHHDSLVWIKTPRPHTVAPLNESLLTHVAEEAFIPKESPLSHLH